MTQEQRLRTKICFVGQGDVGKTSLVRRFVLDMFDDSYIRTIGTKVSKRTMELSLPQEDLVVRIDATIWDIMGHQGFRDLVRDAYFNGAQGILAVADLTRRSTLIDLAGWIEGVERIAGKVPAVIAVNKADLAGQADFGAREIGSIAEAFGCGYLMSSAKTGANVEEAFGRLLTSVAAEQLGFGGPL